MSQIVRSTNYGLKENSRNRMIREQDKENYREDGKCSVRKTCLFYSTTDISWNSATFLERSVLVYRSDCCKSYLHDHQVVRRVIRRIAKKLLNLGIIQMFANSIPCQGGHNGWHRWSKARYNFLVRQIVHKIPGHREHDQVFIIRIRLLQGERADHINLVASLR